YDGLIAEGKSSGKNHACRIYAPVGPHQHLLAYLVRRLLENGANNSFVNQLNNPDTPLKQAVADPLTQILAQGRSPGQPHPKLPAPHQLHLAHRQTAVGLNLACRGVQQTIDQALHNKQPKPCPPNTQNDAQHAIEVAFQAVADWRAQSPARRAECLERAAHLLQQNMLEFTALLVHEAKKTRANAVAEVMEAIDFLYFYAAQVRNTFHNSTHHPLGVVVCISPWNFPLAIFLGQVSAALAAGNTVVAKPAEQTPHVAKRAVELLWQAGIAPQVLQVLHGEGNTVGAALVAHRLVSGVLFTGSVKTAEVIRNNIATHPAPDGQPVRLVAETGGQNAMVVDSSALLEQVVQDVLVSAFDSAGQRCSALRILVVQDDIAQPLLHMLKGAMQALQLGKPEDLQTDVGPLVDQAAATRVQLYIHQMRSRGLPVFQCPAHQEQAQRVANAVAPTLIEIGTPKGLEQEVFGPVLHVLRCKRTAMDGALADIRELGYALTFGIHSRIKQHIDHWLANNNAGNVYVNRNMVGAMVGVQPFGGHGLSGTGPKSGGPLTLLAMLRNAPSDAIQRQLNAMGAQAMDGLEPAYVLPGPTGEHNTYQLKSKRPTPHSVNLDQAQQDWSDFEEQTVSINTAASGGNPSLLAVDDDC
ncbi:MAG TPA: L-glutamate gamma-semialdehyde dehydrogenase, partial [Limnobacter sp.]|nr:L-glutamate gamma-semialdehyde dehydrogenase [Limnobacter sp.]